MSLFVVSLATLVFILVHKHSVAISAIMLCVITVCAGGYCFWLDRQE